MTQKKIIKYVATNDRGMRIGQDHPKAILTNLEVDALILDRGDGDSPAMSYGQLAIKYGISKSSVRDILIGRRRGQLCSLKKKEPAQKMSQKKTRVKLTVTHRTRAILHRIGGAALLERIAAMVEHEFLCAPKISADDAVERVLEKYRATK